MIAISYKVEKIIIIIVTVLGIAGLIWSGALFFAAKGEKDMQQTYQKALSSELEDKCATPDRYTDQGWYTHMSHHPDRYAECFSKENME